MKGESGKNISRTPTANSAHLEREEANLCEPNRLLLPKKHGKMQFFYFFLGKYLVNSKKCSNFARFFVGSVSMRLFAR